MTSIGSVPVRPPRGLVRRILTEPLVHFLVLALGLFVANALFGSDDREVITVDTAAQKFLFKQAEDLRLRPLTENEKAEIVRNYIDEEILVREAKARGFTDSSKIRQLLLQNMRFFIGSDMSDPTGEELRAFYETNKEQFASPLSFDLNHVVFNDPGAVPKDILSQLAAADDPAAFGDTDMNLGYNLRLLDQRALVRLFGPESARTILATEVGDNWLGPFESPRGSVHFLRVAKRNEPQTPTFEEASNWITTQWMLTKNQELLEQALSEMRGNYRVEIVPLPEQDG